MKLSKVIIYIICLLISGTAFSQSGIEQTSLLLDGVKEYKENNFDKAKEHFSEMRSSDISPNVIVYHSLIGGLCKKGHVDKAKELFLEMKSSGISPDVFVYNTLIHGLYQFGNDEEAKTGYCKEGMHKDCKADMLEDAYNLLLEKELVEKMHGKKISPDKDEYGQSWINSLPDCSSLNPSKDTHQISVSWLLFS